MYIYIHIYIYICIYIYIYIYICIYILYIYIYCIYICIVPCLVFTAPPYGMVGYIDICVYTYIYILYTFAHTHTTYVYTQMCIYIYIYTDHHYFGGEGGDHQTLGHFFFMIGWLLGIPTTDNRSLSSSWRRLLFSMWSGNCGCGVDCGIHKDGFNPY